MSGRLHSAFTAVLLVVLVCGGCSKIQTEYGASRSSNGRKSLNGFGALRASYEQAGFRTRDVNRLSERVMRTDAIVWIPQVPSLIDTEVTRWMERWFKQGDRTLVYIIADSGSEADYWIDTARIAPPEQRLEYRSRAAKSVNKRVAWRLNRQPVPSNGWFRIEPRQHRVPAGRIGGSWQQGLSQDSDDTKWLTTEFDVIPYDPDKHAGAGPISPRQMFEVTGPEGAGTAVPWAASLETTPTKTEVEFSPLLVSQSGDPIIVEITSKDWKNSRILVVVGGSLLTNYAFTREFNRALAGRIIDQSAPAGDQDRRVGFMTTNWTKVPVSEVQPDIPAISGMEILTVWPMSLVTMHGVVLGLVICLMLLPIFGRPGRVRRALNSDFGHHLDAVAALMNKTGDERYARARISEYMKRMHGETSGPWILPDPPTPHAAATLTSKRLATAPATDEAKSEDVFEGDLPPGTEKTENDEAEH